MDDALLVCSLQCLGKLGDRRRFIDWNRPLRDAVGKRRPLDQLHHQGSGARRSLQAIDRRDVGMIEGREDFGFALESGQALRI